MAEKEKTDDRTSTESGESESRGRAGVFTNTHQADVSSLGKQLKSARFRHFEFFSDEPPRMGGEDEYPQPLTYLAASLGFCLLTQVTHCATMLKKEVTGAWCHCEFDIRQEGSLLRETVLSSVTEFRTHLTIDSPESEEDIALIIRLAERSCYVSQLVKHAVPLKSEYTVNGASMELDE